MQQVGLNHQVLQTEAVSAGRDHLSDRGCTNPPKDHMTESNSQETSGMITTQLLQLFYTAGQRCKLGLTVCDTIKMKKKKILIRGKQVSSTSRIFIKIKIIISRNVHLEYMSYLRLGEIVLRSWSMVLMFSGLVPVFRQTFWREVATIVSKTLDFRISTTFFLTSLEISLTG